MSVSMKDVDPAFQGAGQKAGIEIWRIENSHPVTVPNSSRGKFFTGDSYVILKTTALKNGVLRHDIHYWIGKNANQDEARTAAIITIELDAAFGGPAVQYRELQGHETEKFLSYFKPCIIPQEGGVASGLKHAETDEHQTRLYIYKGKHVVQVKEATEESSEEGQEKRCKITRNPNETEVARTALFAKHPDMKRRTLFPKQPNNRWFPLHTYLSIS